MARLPRRRPTRRSLRLKFRRTFPIAELQSLASEAGSVGHVGQAASSPKSRNGRQTTLLATSDNVSYVRLNLQKLLYMVNVGKMG